MSLEGLFAPTVGSGNPAPLLYRLKEGEIYGFGTVEPSLIYIGKYYGTWQDAVCLTEAMTLRVTQQGAMPDIPGRFWEAKNVVYSVNRQMLAYAFELPPRLQRVYKDALVQASSSLVRANAMPDVSITR